MADIHLSLPRFTSLGSTSSVHVLSSPIVCNFFNFLLQFPHMTAELGQTLSTHTILGERVRRDFALWTPIYAEVGQLLESGYVLRNRDLAEILFMHGIGLESQAEGLLLRTNASSKFGNHMTRRHIKELTGVQMTKLTYRGRTLYYDSRLDIQVDTDVDQVKSEIDVEINDQRARLLKTTDYPSLE
jgi:hypothetical protein